MDSISNLPFLDIAGEDDSLLFDVPAVTTNVFSCSPLLSLRSNTSQTEGREGGDADSENPSSSPIDGANKENTNWIKPEAQKLGLEPQKMKRKKKGGGYNLRKSLAWDRAFFTEQGVLNPTELSMISGTVTPKAALNLDVIDEEEPVGTSLALQEIEENLFKHSSDGVRFEDRKIGTAVGLSPKPGALAKSSLTPASMAKRKVFAVNDVVGNRSKRSACPRPPGASSLPDSIKVPSKELKANRIPGPKSNVSVSATTARSRTLTTGSLKRNQNVHPPTNVQKYAGAGIKGLSKNPRTVPSNLRMDPADKCSVARTLTKQAGKHLDNTVSEINPPSGMHQSGAESNKVSKVCLPLDASKMVEKKQLTHSQTTKSSGLRMPSPSLGFFSQAKAPSSHNQLQKSSKPCKSANSIIPKLRNLETTSVNKARLSHGPRIRSEIVEGAPKNCTEKLRLIDVKSEPSMHIDSNQMADVEVEYDPTGSEKISKQEKVENNLEHVNIKSKEQGELYKSENASSIQDVVFPREKRKHLSKSHTQEQLEKEADNTDILSNGDQPVYQEPQSMHYHRMQRTSIVKDSISNTVHNAMGQDEDEQIKLLTSDVLTSNESSMQQAKHDTSLKDCRLLGVKDYNRVKAALLNSSLTDISETVLEGSIQGIPCKNTEQVNGGATDIVICGGDVEVHSLNGNLSVYCSETTQSNLEPVNQQLHEEQLKTASPSIVVEISSRKENEIHVNSCELVHMTTLSSNSSPQKSILEIKSASESEPKIAEIEDCQFPVDGQSDIIQRRPVDEGYKQVIVSKVMHDSTKAFESNRLSEHYTTVSATTCCIKVSNVSQESRSFHENNVGNVHFISQLCPMVKADFESRENDMSTNNCCTISEVQPRDDSSKDISIHYDVQHDVPGNSEQQDSSTYSKANEMLCEDVSLVLNHGHLLDQSEFSEVSADFISNPEEFNSSGAENPSCLLQDTLLAQSVQEFDHASREMGESHVEDAQVQSFNENRVTYNCNSKHGIAVTTNDHFSLAGNNYMNEDSHLSDFQGSGAAVGVDSQKVNNILHLDGDWQSTIIASSEEIKKTNLFEGTLEGCDLDGKMDVYTSKQNASNQHIKAMLGNKEGNLDVDEKDEFLRMDNAKKGFSDILPLVEVQLNNNIISSTCGSSTEVSNDSFTDIVAWKSEKQCSLHESSNLPASDDLTFDARIPQVCEVSSLNKKKFSDEGETNIFEEDEFPNNDMQHQAEDGIYFAEDSSEIIHFEKSVAKSRQEVPTVKPPPNAAPFSDEWLAAIEAAGEEILTMKSGAVQNSPPDKPEHEPGPWSPVRRKNQAIGPFDCTKHSIHHSSS